MLFHLREITVTVSGIPPSTCQGLQSILLHGLDQYEHDMHMLQFSAHLILPLVRPGLNKEIKAKSRGDWPSRKFACGTPHVQAFTRFREDEWGPACYSAHQAPPRSRGWTGVSWTHMLAAIYPGKIRPPPIVLPTWPSSAMLSLDRSIVWPAPCHPLLQSNGLALSTASNVSASRR